MAECEAWDSMAPVSCSLAENTAGFTEKGKPGSLSRKLKLYKIIACYIKIASDRQDYMDDPKD